MNRIIFVLIDLLIIFNYGIFIINFTLKTSFELNFQHISSSLEICCNNVINYSSTYRKNWCVHLSLNKNYILYYVLLSTIRQFRLYCQTFDHFNCWVKIVKRLQLQIFKPASPFLYARFVHKFFDSISWIIYH